MRSSKKSPFYLPVYERLLKSLGPSHWWPAETPFEVMLGAILTQNTAWKNVEKALESLKSKERLEPDLLLAMDTTELAEAIRPSGYFNQKAKKIKSLLEWYSRHEFRTDRIKAAFPSPDSTALRQELLSIFGIGPETADSILCYAFELPFFVVDAYTLRWAGRFHRARLGYSYEQMQGEVEQEFKTRWNTSAEQTRNFNEFHALIVRMGNTYCKKRNPLCDECPLTDICEKNL